MNIYACGYSIHAALIEALMHEHPTLLLVDTRYSPRSRLVAWTQPALKKRFGERYRWAGAYLGNINYANGGPIMLADPRTGIGGLIMYLREGHDLILLCGCRDYEQCHLRVIVELLCQQLPSVGVISPETLQLPGTIKCLSVRQPWAWLLTHPAALRRGEMEPKCIENREWAKTTRYRGPLLIHAGSRLDSDWFKKDGMLDRDALKGMFGAAGDKLAMVMPHAQQEYVTKAIVGIAELVDVVQQSTSPWFVGPSGFLLRHARPIEPVVNYPGQLKLFDVPLSVVQSKLRKEEQP